MKDWIGFAVLVLLGWLIKKVVISTYLRLKERIDRAVPDHLPMGGGDWLLTQAPEGVRVVVGRNADAHADAFYPSANVIVLSREVYTKHDASFWAVAAHELGHAIVHRSSWVVGAILMLGRVTVAVCTVVGSFTIFANVLYARPDINAFAFHLLEASLVGYVVVLVDEALASAIAVGILRRDAHLDRRDMIGAITRLLAAFTTYLGGFAGQVILLLQREFIVTQIERHRHFVAAERMGATRMTFVIILSTVLVGWSLLNLRHALRRKQYATAAEVATGCLWRIGHELGRGAVGAALVWLVWDQPYGPMMPLLCVAGLVASRGVLGLLAGIAEVIIRFLAFIPALLIYVAAGIVFKLFAWFVLERDLFTSKDDRVSPPPPPPDSERTKAALDALEVEQANSRGVLQTLLVALDPALHLAFVVGLFVAILGSR